MLSATGGLGLIFYGFAWLFVAYDDEDEDEDEMRKLLTGRVDGHALTAVLFALVGGRRTEPVRARHRRRHAGSAPDRHSAASHR